MKDNSEENTPFSVNINWTDFFHKLKIQQLDIHSESRTYKRGEFIYLQHNEANKIFFIKTGNVKIGAYSEEGKELIKSILKAGDIFGEMALIGELYRSDFAQATTTVEVHLLNVEMAQLLMNKDQSFCLTITHKIGKKLLQTQRKLESLIFKDARTRVVEFLSDLAINNGSKVGLEILVQNFFTHQEIANITGTSRQTVTMVLNNLREKNIIYFDRKKLLVRDLNLLKKEGE